mgnify:CR=1 FL=1
MENKEDKQLTVFGNVGEKERQEAVNNLLTGRTPSSEIRTRKARGGGEVNYVNTYYMVRQIGLLTGFRWSSEMVREKFRPNEEDPVEVGVLMKVTIWDQGKTFWHYSWGQKDVARYQAKYDKLGKLLNPEQEGKIISLFDDLKAAYSDGIKKCLSYFGIASDVYGGKELELYEESGVGNRSEDGSYASFTRLVGSMGLKWSEVFARLEIQSLSEIKDFKRAISILKGGLSDVAKEVSSEETIEPEPSDLPY